MFSDLLIGLILTLMSIYCGAVEMRLKDLKNKVSKEDVLELIDLKQEAIKAMQQDVKEDTAEIKRKLERIEAYLLSNK